MTDDTINREVAVECIICRNSDTTRSIDVNEELFQIVYDLLKCQQFPQFPVHLGASIQDTIHFCTTCRQTLWKVRDTKDEMRALQLELLKLQRNIAETLSGLSSLEYDFESIEDEGARVWRNRIKAETVTNTVSFGEDSLATDNSFYDEYDPSDVQAELITENDDAVNTDVAQVYEAKDSVESDLKPDVTCKQKNSPFCLKPCSVPLIRFEEDRNRNLKISEVYSLPVGSTNRIFRVKNNSKTNHPRPVKNEKNNVKTEFNLNSLGSNSLKLKCSRCKTEFDEWKGLTNHILKEGCTSTLTNSSSRQKLMPDTKKNQSGLHRKHVAIRGGNGVSVKRKDLIRQAMLKYKCPHCGKQLKSTSSLKYHVLHRHVKPRKSPQLKKAAEPSHPCEFCSKVFRKAYCLKSHHLATHYEEYLKKYGGDDKLVEKRKTMHCDVCDKTFSSKEAREEHYSVQHSKQFKCCCEVCGKGFAKQSSMVRHQLSHRNERQFACEQCPLRFNLDQNLKRHLQKVHLVGGKTKRSACNFCPRIFWDKSELNRHVQINHKDHIPDSEKKVYRCEICDYCCPDIIYLIGHKKTRRHLENVAMWSHTTTTNNQPPLPPTVEAPLTNWLLPGML